MAKYAGWGGDGTGRRRPSEQLDTAWQAVLRVALVWSEAMSGDIYSGYELSCVSGGWAGLGGLGWGVDLGG